MQLTKAIGGVVLAGLLILTLALVVGGRLDAQSDMNQGNKDKRTQNIQTFVLNSFEKDGEWKAEFSMFARRSYDPAKGAYAMDTNANQFRLHTGRPWGVLLSNESKVLGVKASFDRKAYNWVEVYPTDEKGQPKTLPMIGRVQALDVWVWGGGFKYKLEIHLEDYQGFRHVVDGGWIDFIGWRNLRIPIPRGIAQEETYIPKLKTLKFAKFLLVANPGERNDVFYVFFDRMQIQSDIYIERFDGDDLVREAMRSTWMPKQPELKIQQ